MRSDSLDTIARYRTLSHDALLAVLEDGTRGGPIGGYIAVVFLLLGGFFLVQGLGLGIERLLTYLGVSRED